MVVVTTIPETLARGSSSQNVLASEVDTGTLDCGPEKSVHIRVSIDCCVAVVLSCYSL